MRVSFPMASDKDHDTHLASYTTAENKWSLGEIKIVGRDVICRHSVGSHLRPDPVWTGAGTGRTSES